MNMLYFLYDILLFNFSKLQMQRHENNLELYTIYILLKIWKIAILGKQLVCLIKAWKLHLFFLFFPPSYFILIYIFVLLYTYFSKIYIHHDVIFFLFLYSSLRQMECQNQFYVTSPQLRMTGVIWHVELRMQP